MWTVRWFDQSRSALMYTFSGMSPCSIPYISQHDLAKIRSSPLLARLAAPHTQSVPHTPPPPNGCEPQPSGRPRYLGRGRWQKTDQTGSSHEGPVKNRRVLRSSGTSPNCVWPSSPCFHGSMPVPSARVPYMGGAWRKLLNKRHASRV